MERLAIRIRRLRPGAQLPAKASPDAAGADLCACLEDDLAIGPGETALVPTGLAAEIPAGYAGFVFARSGLASRGGLAPANKVGVIDADYRGELLVALHNHGKKSAVVEPGQRVAQLVILPVPAADYIEAEALSQTERGAGGFGSTGK